AHHLRDFLAAHGRELPDPFRDQGNRDGLAYALGRSRSALCRTSAFHRSAPNSASVAAGIASTMRSNTASSSRPRCLASTYGTVENETRLYCGVTRSGNAWCTACSIFLR